MMCERSERIEQIFQRVEEESARRAREEAEADMLSSLPNASTVTGASSAAAFALLSVPSTSSTTSAQTVRERRRGSVSVSRFGQAATADMLPPDSPVKPQAAPAPVSSYIVRKPTFYQAQVHATSADSLASLHEDPARTIVDEEQVVQVVTIAGRQSLSKAFSRRLSRSRSYAPDDLAGALVIGVKVEEAQVEVEAEAEVGAGAVGEERGATRGESRSLPGAGLASNVGVSVNAERDKDKNGWIGKAKELSQKLRRRSTVSFPPTAAMASTACSTTR